MGTYQEIAHTADYALLLRGADLRDLVQAAGEGFVALVSDERRPKPVRTEEYEVTAEDAAVLVMRAVRELLYYVEEGELPVAFEALSAGDRPATARLRVGLVPLAAARGHLQRAIKAVTYHDLQMRSDDQGLNLTLTFDT